MDALAVLRLSLSPRRYNPSLDLAEHDDESALSTPYASAPSSPRRGFAREVEEAPLGEVRAAVPFIWESIPGTPRKEIESRIEETRPSDGPDETGCEEHGSSISSSSLSRDSSTSEFEFSSRFTGVVERLALSTPPMSTAEELFSNGQLLPLRLPPRLQAVKYLRNSDSSFSDDSSNGSLKNCSCPQSPRSPRAHSPRLKMISLCGLAKSPGRGALETSILGMQERPGRESKHRSRSLSPLRLFKREDSAVSDLFSEILSFSESVSSVSSSSSSAGEKSAETPKEFWPFFKEKRNMGRTLKDFLYTDYTPEAAKIETSRLSSEEVRKIVGVKPPEEMKSLPRVVESRRELFKQNQEVAAPKEVEKTSGQITPLLSRSNARSSRSARLPLDVQVKPLRKAYTGKLIFANRFGLLTSCLGIPPASP